MNPITRALMKTGLLSAETLEEMRKWGFPTDEIPKVVAEDPDDVAQLLEQALSEEGYLLRKETDLDLLTRYAETKDKGLLCVDDGAGATAEFPVTFGRTFLGHYVIAWRSESIRDLMTNGLTHLKIKDGHSVYFREVRDLYFGDSKAFMVCEPSVKEPDQ